MVSNKELLLLDRQFLDYTMLLKVDTRTSIIDNRKIRIGGIVGHRSFTDTIYLYIGDDYYGKYDAYGYNLADR